MKFLLPVKTFLLTNKFIALIVAVFTLIVGGSIAYANFDTKTTVLGVKMKKQSVTPTVVPTDSPTPKISATPTGTKNSNTTAGKVPTPTTVSGSSTNQTNPTVTNTPAPTQAPSSPTNVINGVTFSSFYPTVTIKPGESKTAFAMSSGSTKHFEIYDSRVIGSTGLSFSPMSGTIDAGQTKDIIISASPDATPGTFGGFIGISIDGVYPQQKLQITVTVEGNNPNNQSLKLTGPAGGSVYKIGDDIVITWDATNISGDFGLSVQSDTGEVEDFANVDNSQRSYTWKADKMFAPTATHFRFTITGGPLVSHAVSDITINNY